MKKIKNWILHSLVALLSGAFLVGSAQVATMPMVDLNIGPVAVNAQAVNVALALSVEFPTAGSAYRNTNYNHATEYLGYWDPKGCYDYRDTTTGAPMAGEYFYRTGTVDTDRYCNTVASGTSGSYSGNALNYVATSSIDLLRYALTGGDRVADTATFTILGRAYLPGGFLHNYYFPTKRIAAALEGKVTPDYPDSNTADVLAGSCDNRVVFGRNNTNTNCNAPGTSGDLNKVITTFTGTNTTLVNATSATGPSSTPPSTFSIYRFTTTTYSITSNTTTVAPSTGPVLTYTYITTGAGTSTTPPAPIGVFGPTATYFVSSYYTATGALTAVTPTVGPIVLAGTFTSTFAVRNFSSAAPPLPYRTFSVPSGATNRVCKASAASFVGSLNSSGAIQDVGGSDCGAGVYTGFATRARFNATPVTTLPMTVYERYRVNQNFRVQTLVNIYRTATLNTAFYVYNAQLQDSWDTPIVSGTAPAPMFARVKVCDGSEATSRTDLCLRYPDGNYKPAGEIQRRNEGMRVAAFGYVLDNVVSRYGGVLRAPMRYTGPTYRDSAGATQVNTAPEWNVNNGVFRSDPLGASPTFSRSGVVNYLNKFGSTGAYKGFDPVGELYYEALRYYQGLGPTADAASGLATAMYDNFPVYSTAADGAGTFAGWTDPVENSCQRRNFILGIGDVNTHRDRQLPGHGGTTPASVPAGGDDAARGVEPMPGDATKSFNAVYWTSLLGAFETGAAVSYTDALGRTQSTAGNPNPVSGNANLNTKPGGSGGSGAYYWAGAAYWANTQPIRLDTKGGKPMKDVRVKTFMIDVDEGGSGAIVNTRSFLLAGKYGWFNDANLDGNPFKTAGGVYNNSEWQDPEEPLVPDGYVVASQAQRMLDGIRKFFAAATSEKGAVSVSSLSSQRFTTKSPNGDLFAPRFDTRDWSGTVQKTRLRLNTTTQSIESEAGAVWDAGAILTSGSLTSGTVADPIVMPVDRRIFTLGASTGGRFIDTALSELDPAVRTSLDTDPATGTVDNNAAKRVRFLRGDRTDEKTSAGGIFRRRNNIMGDVINSGPIFKAGADPTVSGPGYGAFASSVAARDPAIFVGTNGGMLHAFRASDGKEQFAYVPKAVSLNLNKLTDPNYAKRPYVDAVPIVREAQIGTTWQTILASGMGGGAQGIFVLDVTNPATFDGSNVKFEFTDADDPYVGNIITQPKIVKIKTGGSTSTTFKWYVVFGSGYNNYVNDGRAGNGKQSLFLLSLDKLPSDSWVKDTNYFRIDVGTPDINARNALANPGYEETSGGDVRVFYSGDLQGQMWRFDLSFGLNTAYAEVAVKNGPSSPVPLFIAKDSTGNRQPITTSPQVVRGLNSGYMVVFGTGKFVEPTDSASIATQTLYGVWDPLNGTDPIGNFNTVRAALFQRTVVEGTASATLSGANSFTFSVTAPSTGYRGWYFDLNVIRERISVEGASAVGLIAFNSTIPEGECSGDGSGREYCLSPHFGTALCTIRTVTDSGLLGRPNIIEVNYSPQSLSPITLEDSFGGDGDTFTKRGNTGKRASKLTLQIVTTGTKLTDAGNALVTGTGTGATKTSVTIPSGRLSWREVRNFEQ